MCLGSLRKFRIFAPDRTCLRHAADRVLKSTAPCLLRNLIESFLILDNSQLSLTNRAIPIMSEFVHRPAFASAVRCYEYYSWEQHSLITRTAAAEPDKRGACLGL